MRTVVGTLAFLALMLETASASDRYQVSVVPDLLGLNVTNPIVLTEFRGELYFRGHTSAHGYELFKYDGDTQRLVADIAPGPSHGNPAPMTVFRDELYFEASDGGTGFELFKYDGSIVSHVADIHYGEAPTAGRPMHVFEDKLLFSALTPSGYRMHSFDGVSISAFNVEPFHWSIEFGGKLLFSGRDDLANGIELFEFDGSNVRLFEDIVPGSESSQPRSFIKHNGNVVFAATSGLFEYDGVSVKQLASGISTWELVEFQGDIYFAAETGTETGNELYKFDGSNISLVADIIPGRVGSGPGNFQVFDGNLFFSARRQDVGYELFRFDGESVSLVKDINPGTSSSNPEYSLLHNGELFVRAYIGVDARLIKLSVIPEPTAFALASSAVLLAVVVRQSNSPLSRRLRRPLRSDGHLGG